MTLSVWAKWLGQRYWDSYLRTKGQGFLGKRSAYSDNGMKWTLWISADPGIEGALGLGHYPTTQRPDLVSAQGTMDPFIGKWAHVAATFDGNTAKLYLNGGEVDSGLWNLSHGPDPNIFLTIGQTTDQNGWNNGPASFYGYLDEVRIYNRALEPNEIAYLADPTPEDGYLQRPVPSNAEIYVDEPVGQQVVNFKDYALVAKKWLEEDMYP
jgi:hypothetical protein